MSFAKTLRAYGARLIADPLGKQQKLSEFLTANNGLKTPFFAHPESTSLEDVFPWDRFSEELVSFRARKWVPRSEVNASPGQTVGHFGMRAAYTGSGDYVGVQSTLHRLPPLTKTIDHAADHAFDVRDLRGFGASKGDLKGINTIEEFIASARPQWVENAAPEVLAEIVKSVDEIPRRVGDRVTRFGWEEGVWFENTDGSHRVAAMNVLSTRLGLPTALAFPAREVLLNEAGLQALHEQWSVYMVSSAPGTDAALVSRLEFAGAQWTSMELSVGKHNVKVLFFDRRERAASAAAEQFANAGYVEVGQHLIDAHRRQCEAQAPQLIPAHSISAQERDRADVCR